MSATISATANTVAEPRSSRARFGGRDSLSSHGDTGQQRCGDADPRDDAPAVAPHLHRGPVGAGALGRVDGGTVVATGRQPGRFPCRVDAAHLSRHRGEPADTEHRDRDECGDRERRLDRDATPVITWW